MGGAMCALAGGKVKVSTANLDWCRAGAFAVDSAGSIGRLADGMDKRGKVLLDGTTIFSGCVSMGCIGNSPKRVNSKGNTIGI